MSFTFTYYLTYLPTYSYLNLFWEKILRLFFVHTTIIFLNKYRKKPSHLYLQNAHTVCIILELYTELHY